MSEDKAPYGNKEEDQEIALHIKGQREFLLIQLQDYIETFQDQHTLEELTIELEKLSTFIGKLKNINTQRRGYIG